MAAIRRSALALAAVILTAAVTATAESSVTIESKQVAPGTRDVQVGVYISNDEDAMGLVAPLEIRSITPGAFIADAFDIQPTGRVARSGLTDLSVTRLCGEPAELNRYSGPISHTWSCVAGSGIPEGFFESPSGVMWAGICTTGPMMARGTDPPGEPSLTLTFDIPDALGRFEIDTCCMTPSNHLLFANGRGDPALAIFARGIVTIGEPLPNNCPVAHCHDTTVNLRGRAAVEIDADDIDAGSYDPDRDFFTITLEPPGPYSVGESPVLFIISDGKLADTCMAVIRAAENRVPVAQCNDLTINDTYNCQGHADVWDVDAGSYDPDGDPIERRIELTGPYPIGETAVRLIVSDGLLSDTCVGTITVGDPTAPIVECPAATYLAIDEQHQPRIPDVTGRVGLCARAEEFVVSQNPPAGWFFTPGLETISVMATNEEADTIECQVEIINQDDLLHGGPTGPGFVAAVEIDILPGSCPNSMPAHAADADQPVLSATVLGREYIDVAEIDVSVLRLAGVAPQHWEILDAASPATASAGDLCACANAAPDGYPDLHLEFDWNAIVSGLGEIEADTLVPLILTGRIGDVMLAGGDCLTLVAPGRPADSDPVVGAAAVLRPIDNYPNPFNSGTVIRFTLSQASPVRLEVFNVLGQRVRTLIDDVRRAGPNQINWDGRDRLGRVLPSGFYLCRLTAEGRTETRKMVLLR